MISSKISVIIPMYNRAQLVEETLRSVMNQTFTDWECIVVDDGSTDGSVDVVEEMSKEDARIRLIKRNREPKGANTCRNIGIDYSTGEFLMFLDSDDLMDPDCLAYRYQQILTHPQQHFWVFQTVFFEQYPYDKPKIMNLLHKPDNTDIDRFLSLDNPWNMPAAIIASSWLREVNVKFDELLLAAQDINFYVHLLLHQPHYMKFDGRPDVHIRTGNQDNISKQKVTRKHLDNRVVLIERMYILFHQYNQLNNHYRNKIFKLSLPTAFIMIQEQHWKGYYKLAGLLSRHLNKTVIRILIDLYIFYNQRAYNSLNPIWKVIRKIYTVFQLIPDLEDTAPYRSTFGEYSLEEYNKVISRSYK